MNDTSKCCTKLHELFNSLKRFGFPFEEKEIPLNGIYVLFEKGELAHGAERIVRVGTHTGKNQLCSRLKQHFLMENKDRSIFRKNIGRAILKKESDSFLKDWELDLTPAKAKSENLQRIDFEKQKKVEKKVSGCIQNNFTFAVFQVDSKEERLGLEAKLIAAIAQCTECKPSSNWLGKQSPIEKISNGKLWLVQHLNAKALEEKELEGLKQKVKWT